MEGECVEEEKVFCEDCDKFAQRCEAYLSDLCSTERTLQELYERDCGAEDSFHAHPVEVVIKYDTACSRNMSGNPDRVDPSTMYIRDVVIKGFNNSVSSATTVGLNPDGKEEYFVASMPRNLALLCAHEYTKEGATVLFPDGGKVMQLTAEQQRQLKEFIRPFPLVKKLVVRNRTYEVDQRAAPSPAAYSATVAPAAGKPPIVEEANSNTATRYFNSKVNVSNTQERVLATLLTGLSFQDLYSMVKNSSADGLPRDLSMRSLNNFEHRYGRTPDVLQLAVPNLAGNTKGYMAPKAKLDHCGQRVEADYFESEFNDPSAVLTSTDTFSSARKKVGKLPTHGGAVAAFVAIDAYSSYVHGQLVRNLQDAVEQVKSIVDMYRIEGYKIEVFAADQGVVSQSMFRVHLPETQQYLNDQGIASECGEPYNHDNGTTHVERVGRSVKELQRFAILYVLNNPNFASFGFSKTTILMLWGELFYWAMLIINLKPCPMCPGQTKYEVFHKRKPDLRELRLLPIFCSLQILRRSDHQALQSTREHWQKGLYVGPSRSVKGAVRVAVMTNGNLRVITTTAFKAVSDGGNINPYESVSNAIPSLIKDSTPPNIQPPRSVHFAAVPDTDTVNYPLSMPSVAPSTAVVADEQPSTVRGSSETPPSRDVVPVPVVNSSTSEVSERVHRKARKNKKMKPADRSRVEAPPPTPARSRVEAPPPTPARSRVDTPPPLQAKSRVEAPPVLQSRGILHVEQEPPIRRHPKEYIPAKTSREERMKSRSRAEPPDHISYVAELIDRIRADVPESIRRVAELNDLFQTPVAREECNFVDWSEHKEGVLYWSFELNKYVDFRSYDPSTGDPYPEGIEESYRAVTENVPKSFAAALCHPDWAEPARTELRTIVTDTKAVVEADQNIAKENIRNGAEVLRMIAVYEEKTKNNVLVRKVRLVADGRHHNKHGPTYASTPSREELFILLHLFATDDMDYFVIDQVRAFLSAKKRDDNVTYAKFSGDHKFYEILNALYGMKTASRDHQLSVVELLTSLGFQRLAMCASIYKLEGDGFCIIAYVYVDDFIFGGSCNTQTLGVIEAFRKVSQTSEPELNASSFLGMEVIRDKERRIIKVTMKKKIAEICERFSSAVMRNPNDTYPNGELRKRNVPIPTTGYIVKDYEFEKLPEHKSRFLSQEEIVTYMQLVGSLIWVQGVRMDIIFAVLYLTWFTKNPRQHHMDMAEYCLGYLANTIDVPLVLGGKKKMQLHGYTDASLATGPKSRSITASIVKMNEDAGAVSAKSTAGHTIPLSSFEAELEGTTGLFKHASRVTNVTEELPMQMVKPSLLWSDNDAMIKFVKGEGVAKGVRHMEMRMWYTRDEYARGKYILNYMPGVIIPTDKLTKLGSAEGHRQMQRDVMGLKLLDSDYDVD